MEKEQGTSIAQQIIKGQFWIIIFLIASLLISNLAWLYAWNSYEYDVDRTIAEIDDNDDNQGTFDIDITQ